MSSHSNQVAFITGASSGIGAELAREFGRRGFSVAICARRKDRLEALCQELTAQGVECFYSVCDVSDEQAMQNTVAHILQKFGRVDVVIANAGYADRGSLQKQSLQDYRKQIETNVFGVLNTIYPCLEELKKNRGCLSIIGSIAGYVPLHGSSAYCMSKHAVKALSLALRSELKQHGVSVTLITAGFIKSEIFNVDSQGVRHQETQHSIPEWIKMPTAKAAKKIAKATLNRRREKTLTIHGFLGKQLHRFFPRFSELMIPFGVPKDQ